MNSRKLFPKTFFGRSLVIILIPVLLLQLVLIYFFYERHWDDVGRRLALALGGQISFIIKTLEEKNFEIKDLETQFKKAESNLLMKTTWHPNESLKKYGQKNISSLLDKTLKNSLAERINYPYKFDTKLIKNKVIIYVNVNNGILKFSVARKNLYSSTIEVFIMWMLITAFFLLTLALYFMKQQIKPLRNIILAAEEFGRGNNHYELKPRGAYELRQLSKVFIKMRARINNQINNRTLMLAGISHDLRTPLTRMNLQIALLQDKNAIKNLSDDVSEMREMIDTYLAFSKGEKEENVKNINIYNLVKKLCEKDVVNESKVIKNKINKNFSINLKPLAMKRALLNILSNAVAYSKSYIEITARRNSGYLSIYIEDDGKGIPKNKRKDVFRAFYREDESRLSDSANTGLGLTIAKDIIQSHGGKIILNQSKLGGLKVELYLPRKI
jgi:two-component system osmolarity sensor histidine kinase EnvZ